MSSLYLNINDLDGDVSRGVLQQVAPVADPGVQTVAPHNGIAGDLADCTTGAEEEADHLTVLAAGLVFNPIPHPSVRRLLLVGPLAGTLRIIVDISCR